MRMAQKLVRQHSALSAAPMFLLTRMCQLHALADDIHARIRQRGVEKQGCPGDISSLVAEFRRLTVAEVQVATALGLTGDNTGSVQTFDVESFRDATVVDGENA
jgi:hypothetical protein